MIVAVVDVGGFESVLRVWYSQYYRTSDVSVVIVVLAIAVDVGGFEGVLRLWYPWYSRTREVIVVLVVVIDVCSCC